MASGFEDLTVLEVTHESVTLAWQPPKDNGGSEITSYIVVMKEGDKPKYKKIEQVDANTLTFQVLKVKEGHDYKFRVYAENAIGVSKESAGVTSAIKTPKREKEKKEEVKEEEEKVEEEVKIETKEEQQQEVKEEMVISVFVLKICMLSRNLHVKQKSACYEDLFL